MRDEDVLKKCSSRQAERLRGFMDNGWRVEDVDDSDGAVLIRKGFSYKWVKRDGFTCMA